MQKVLPKQIENRYAQLYEQLSFVTDLLRRTGAASCSCCCSWVTLDDCFSKLIFKLPLSVVVAVKLAVGDLPLCWMTPCSDADVAVLALKPSSVVGLLCAAAGVWWWARKLAPAVDWAAAAAFREEGALLLCEPAEEARVDCEGGAWWSVDKNGIVIKNK